ncbi:hypothetical protein AB0756_39870 [Tolypothrix campylonemoides VB511288_2]|uniref:Uncharacterized protein n=3 Tax=Nostocales TaxID=1161 RepID=A0A0C1R504_9CYAN
MFAVKRLEIGQTYKFHGSTICFKRIAENNGRKRFIFQTTTGKVKSLLQATVEKELWEEININKRLESLNEQ